MIGRWIFAVLLAGVAASPVLRAAEVAVVYRGSHALGDSALDQFGDTFMVTGMSGIVFAGDGALLAVMDNSDKVVSIAAEFAADGTISEAVLTGGRRISESRDFEGIAPGGEGFFLSEEGTPAVREFDAAGVLRRAFTTPAVFASRRSNLGFESLARIGVHLWTANEEALTVDGARSTPEAGTVVRLLRYDAATGEPGPQFAYLTDPMHGAAIEGSKAGLSDLLALPGGRLLALERSFAFSFDGFFRGRIYEIDLAGATDVSGFGEGLIGETYVTVSKRLLWSGDAANLEGLALGPRLGGDDTADRYVLVGIVDDGDPISTNRLHTWELSLPVCRADFNSDGVLNINDFIAFQAAWRARDSRADFDGSGSFTVNDFIRFQAAFARGC